MDKSLSDKTRFEGVRGGVHHRYEVRPEALHYSAGQGSYAKEATIPWRDVAGLRPGRGHSVYLVRTNKQSFGIWLSPSDLDAFMTAAVAAWGKAVPETARKATFDYGSREPSVGWIWLVLSLAFPGMLALLLLVDGYHELSCNRWLARSGQAAQAHIVKIKKNRRGNFIWTMEFDTAEGKHLTGTREAPLAGPDGEPIGSKDTATVVYSPDDLTCWDLSLKQGQVAVNRGQRRFTVLMDLSFGWIFAFVGAVAVVLSLGRIIRRHPAREAVLAASQKI